MNPSEVPQTWRAAPAPAPHDLSDPAPRPGFEELYQALDAAVDATAALVVLAQSLLPDEVSVTAFVALQELARLKQVVNPGPTEADPF